MPSEKNHLVYYQVHKLLPDERISIEKYRHSVGAVRFDGTPIQIDNCYQGEWMVCGDYNYDDDPIEVTTTRMNPLGSTRRTGLSSDNTSEGYQ